MEESNKLEQTPLDLVSEAVFLIDLHGIIQQLNPSAEKIFGYKPDELIGNPIATLFRFGWHNKLQTIDRYLDELIYKSSDSIGITRDNKTLYLEIQYKRVDEKFIVVIKNLTDEANLIKFVQKNELIMDTMTEAQTSFINDSSVASLLSIYNQILQSLLMLTESKHGFIASIDIEANSTNNIKLTCCASTSSFIFDELEFFNSKVLKSEEALTTINYQLREIIKSASPIISGLPQNPSYLNRDLIPINNFMGIPLLKENRLMGIVSLLNTDRPEYSHSDIPLILPILQTCILIMENSRMEAEKKEAIHSLITKEAMLSNSMFQFEQQAKEQDLHRSRMAQCQQSEKIFLANMSSELKNPLNSIMGMADLLLYSELNEKQKKYALSMYHSAEILVSLINDIQDITTIESGLFLLEEVDFNLKELVQEVISLFDEKVKEKQLELTVTYDPDIPPFFKGDANRVRQILLNIVGNAIKYTENGFVKLKVLLKRKEAERAFISFQVQDSGIGIEKENLEKIFNKIFQLDQNLTRKYNSTGLGLAISKKLVEKMGGEISVESEQGVGSVFRFFIPLVLAEDRKHKVLDPEKLLEDKRILFIAKHMPNQHLLESYVSHWKMKSTRCESLQNAIETIIESKKNHADFDYIIADAGIDSGRLKDLVDKKTKIIKMVNEQDNRAEKEVYYLDQPVMPVALKKLLIEIPK